MPQAGGKEITIVLPRVQSSVDLTKHIEKQINKRLHDNLAISFIDPSVGFGVFAREPIPMGTVLAIYRGGSVNDHGEYVFTLNPEAMADTSSQESIACFFQHLPYNIDLFCKHMQEAARNIDLYKRINLLNKTPEEEMRKLNTIGSIEILHIDTQALKERLLWHSPQANWHCERINFNKNSIAYQNIAMQAVVLDGEPALYLYSTCDIERYQIIGFDYGESYWSMRKAQMPKLFKIEGHLLPKVDYQYKYVEYSISLPYPPFRSSYLIAKENYLKDIEAGKPIQFEVWTKPVSNFSLRRYLVENNVLSEQYGGLSLEGIAKTLHLVWSSAIKINFDLFYHHPEIVVYKPGQNVVDIKASLERRKIMDLVCTLEARGHWEQLRRYIEKSNIHKLRLCRYFEVSKEIIFMGINLPENQPHYENFINQLKTTDWKSYFYLNPREHYSEIPDDAFYIAERDDYRPLLPEQAVQMFAMNNIFAPLSFYQADNVDNKFARQFR